MNIKGAADMYDIVSLDELLIDFPQSGISAGDMRLFEQNAGGAVTPLRPDELNQEMLRNTRLLHTGSLSLTQEPSRSATYEAIDIAKDAGAIISYAPHYRASLWKSQAEAIRFMRSLIVTADIMKVSDEELPLLTGEAEPAKAADALLDQGVRIIAIPLNAEGVYVRVGKESRIVRGFQTTSIDTTDAGDCFFGAFITRFLSSGRTLKKITIDDVADYARFGNAAASLCVKRRDDIRAMPTLNEILEHIHQ